MKNGWIKLHRKIQENPIYKNSKALHCWIECLLRANHSPQNYFLGRKKITLNKGEFILGRDEFSKSIGISGSTAWFWIERFKVDSMLDIKKTSKGCLCSVKNWKNYQEVDSNVDNKKTAKKQQINTDKNDNNKKNEKNTLAANAAGEIFNYNATLKNWIEGNNKIYSLIGKFFSYKELTFKTREQMQTAAKRHLRAAKDLQFFTDEQIDESLNKITQKENLKNEFTLDTILKYLTK